MKVLVTGASGFLGRACVDRLIELGHKVRAVVRPASPAPNWGEEVENVRADLRASNNLEPLFEGVDAVLHLAAATSGNEDLQFASTVVGTERFLEAMAKSSVNRLVHVSSFVVYDWEHARGSLNENTPLLKDPYRMGGYAIAKVWQERIVIEISQKNSWDLTIVRPGFIWDARHADIAGMGRPLGKFHIMFGPRTRLPLTHVINCADCLVTLIESRSAIGEIFNVIDGDEIRVREYARQFARQGDKGKILLPVPYFVGYGIAYLASFVSRRLFGDKGKLPSLLTLRRFEAQFKPLRFSNQKLKDLVGWGPLLSFAQCLKSDLGS